MVTYTKQNVQNISGPNKITGEQKNWGPLPSNVPRGYGLDGALGSNTAQTMLSRSFELLTLWWGYDLDVLHVADNT